MRGFLAGENLRPATDECTGKVVSLSIRLFVQTVKAQADQQMKERIANDDPRVGVVFGQDRECTEGLFIVTESDCSVRNREK
jgi:hypothetical protein